VDNRTSPEHFKPRRSFALASGEQPKRRNEIGISDMVFKIRTLFRIWMSTYIDEARQGAQDELANPLQS
jgi:hypothetical protein